MGKWRENLEWVAFSEGKDENSENVDTDHIQIMPQTTCCCEAGRGLCLRQPAVVRQAEDYASDNLLL